VWRWNDAGDAIAVDGNSSRKETFRVQNFINFKIDPNFNSRREKKMQPNQIVRRVKMPSLALITLGLLIALVPVVAQAQPTAFTYQGQLKDAGSLASGSYDMVFRLFDAEIDGTQLGTDQAAPGTAVADGLFTATIDFGAGLFDGPPRWLEIEVNTIVLSPRQALTSTPYAQRAIDSQTCSIAQSSYSADYAYAPWVPSGTDLYYTGGNVGVGTATPTARLEVAGEAGVDGIKFPDGSLQTTAAIGGGGDSIWSLSGVDAYYNAGKVGVGTSAPNAKLHAVGGPLWTTNSWTKSMALNYAEAIELGYGAGSTRFGIGSSQNGLYFFNTSTEDTADSAHYFMSADAAGRVSVGDIAAGAPTAKLNVFAAGDGAELLRLHTERPWIFRQIYSGPSSGLQLYSTSGAKNFEITCASGVNCATFYTLDAGPRVGIGTTTPTTTLDVNGTTRTKVLQITGADLAEKFPTSGGRASPGTVMEIDPDHPGKLRMSRGAYNQRVAGVVSGANDFPAGAILGHMSGSENEPPIALSGRVWVECDASDSSISPGDLMTTSNIPGRAMKAVDRERSHGAIIGKAMTQLKSGRGLVLVLVNLQ
jgi:hypothetical protein